MVAEVVSSQSVAPLKPKQRRNNENVMNNLSVIMSYRLTDSQVYKCVIWSLSGIRSSEIILNLMSCEHTTFTY